MIEEILKLETVENNNYERKTEERTQTGNSQKNEIVIKVVKITLNIKVKIMRPPEWNIKKMLCQKIIRGLKNKYYK